MKFWGPAVQGSLTKSNKRGSESRGHKVQSRILPNSGKFVKLQDDFGRLRSELPSKFVELGPTSANSAPIWMTASESGPIRATIWGFQGTQVFLGGPHPNTNRVLCRLTTDVTRDPVHSTRSCRQRGNSENLRGPGSGTLLDQPSAGTGPPRSKARTYDLVAPSDNLAQAPRPIGAAQGPGPLRRFVCLTGGGGR